MLKVYYLASTVDYTYYERCMLPLIHNGWDGTKTSLLGREADEEQSKAGCMDADVIVFDRPGKAELEVLKKFCSARKERNRLKLKDISDAKLDHLANKLLVVDASSFDTTTYENEALALCDLVTVPDDEIAAHARKYATHVAVLPNCHDKDDWEVPEMIHQLEGNVRKPRKNIVNHANKWEKTYENAINR